MMRAQLAGLLGAAAIATAALLAPAGSGLAQTTAPATTPSEPAKVPKTTDQIPLTNEPAPAVTAPVAPAPGTAEPPPSTGTGTENPAATPPAEEQPGAEQAPDGGATADEPSLGEIPDFKAVELKPETARAAVDAYLLLKDKYKDAKLEDFETLQDFVDKDAQGKAFEADVKAAGFANVDVWNQTITTVTTTYANIVNDQTDELRQQIEEVEKDTELAQDMKDRMIGSLKALIPSEANKAIVQGMQNDPAYSEKLKQLETEAEEE